MPGPLPRCLQKFTLSTSPGLSESERSEAPHLVWRGLPLNAGRAIPQSTSNVRHETSIFASCHTAPCGQSRPYSRGDGAGFYTKCNRAFGPEFTPPRSNIASSSMSCPTARREPRRRQRLRGRNWREDMAVSSVLAGKASAGNTVLAGLTHRRPPPRPRVAQTSDFHLDLAPATAYAK